MRKRLKLSRGKKYQGMKVGYMKEDCIFCKILNGKAEVSLVAKNDYVTAFMDLHPIQEGHTLVIPNKHFQWFQEIEPIYLEEMFKMAQKVQSAILKSDIKCDGTNFFLSDGEVAGQEVMHSHLHVCPRFKNDGLPMGFSHGGGLYEWERAMLDDTAGKIRKGF